MKQPKLFRQYIWIINTIMKAGKISLSELNRRWMMTSLSEGVKLARTSFYRHRMNIEEMFGVNIECDMATNMYYIENAASLRGDSVQNWMVSTLTVSNVISESLSLQDRIILESVSSDGDLLQIAIQAMKDKKKVVMEYQKYGFSDVKTYVMAPYCIKLWRQRWYLLGHIRHEATDTAPAREHFAVFSFDRMLSLDVIDETFEVKPDFQAEAYFRDFYGVLTDDKVEPAKVVMRAFGNQRYYLRDLPLHPSQKETEETEEYSDFTLRLRPTPDFITQLVSLGSQVKVMSPQWVADKVRDAHEEAFRMYQ